jgi:hypothetical protein
MKKLMLIGFIVTVAVTDIDAAISFHPVIKNHSQLQLSNQQKLTNKPDTTLKTLSQNGNVPFKKFVNKAIESIKSHPKIATTTAISALTAALYGAALLYVNIHPGTVYAQTVVDAYGYAQNAVTAYHTAINFITSQASTILASIKNVLRINTKQPQ